VLFHTWPFAVFFLVFYPIYLLLKGTRWKNYWLLSASYFFYGWWNPLYLGLILWSTLIDYVAVELMWRTDPAKRGWRKLWLVLSIINNLALLGFFKYGQFVVDNLNALGLNLPPPDFLLPVGISFYVFQSMSYTIDFYRNATSPEPNFIRFATFVSLFPQLVAGPIERARNLLPQLRREPQITLEDVSSGASLFIIGLFKKVALADYLALYVDPVYASPDRYEAPALALATFAFGWQIYFDFSGYTDMARGIGRAMGIKLMLNFNRPYLATDLRDFWQRWHISLSSWFRDYVYIPLGGNRKGELRTYVNIALTMLISGLWHGAAWTFVAWGALHAIGYMIMPRAPRRSFVRWVATFSFVTLAWVFFRAASFADAWAVLEGISRMRWADPQFPILMGAFIAAAWLYEWGCEAKLGMLESSCWRIGALALMVIYLMLFGGAGDQAFIYFQF
jgi:D-alanyl-lipoteichoic acid acyltransferase DltB (MBOAT superfamily)